jgi:hypothetical protein
MYNAEAVASAVAQQQSDYPAPLVHDLWALDRWDGCDGETVKDLCIAAVRMLLLSECTALVGSLSR